MTAQISEAFEACNLVTANTDSTAGYECGVWVSVKAFWIILIATLSGCGGENVSVFAHYQSWLSACKQTELVGGNVPSNTTAALQSKEFKKLMSHGDISVDFIQKRFLLNYEKPQQQQSIYDLILGVKLAQIKGLKCGNEFVESNGLLYFNDEYFNCVYGELRSLGGN